MTLLNADDLVSFVLICQDALNAKLLATLTTVCLDRLHVSDVLVAKLGDQAILVD